MNKLQKLFIPPSEQHSLKVHLTHGCINGRCSFCSMKNTTDFFVVPHILVKEEINCNIDHNGTYRRALLLHGDCIALPLEDLLEIIKYIKQRNPFMESISILGKTSSIMECSSDKLSTLKENGLTRIYQPIISGSNDILKDLDISVSNEDQFHAASKIKEAGLELGQSIVLGTAENDNLQMNAYITAKHLSNMKPDYISAVELTNILHTRFNPDFDLEDFDSESALLNELITLISNIDDYKTIFSSSASEEALCLRIDLKTQRNYFLAMLEELLRTRSSSEKQLLANIL